MNARRRPWLRPFCVGLAALVGATVSINLLAAGTGVPDGVGGRRPPASITRAGNGDFTFDGPGALAGSPIRVWYNAPSTDVATAQILMVMTGAHRDGQDHRGDWLPLLAGRHTLLLVLEFDRADYPDVASYNLGGMFGAGGKLQPQENWSFNMVEAVFDRVVRDVGSTATDYAIFGHSAGGQFVHRFVELMPQSRARIAVPANAGWYTMPDSSVPFPYGLEGSPVGRTGLRKAYSRKLVVMLGADDVDPRESSLQRDPQTNRQGSNRLARGLEFYRTAREDAGTKEPFNWLLLTVSGVAHDHAGMARAAAPLRLEPVP